MTTHVTDILALRSRRVLADATKYAQHFGADAVAPEHILLGLLDDERGAAVAILRVAGGDLGLLRAEAEGRCGIRDPEADAKVVRLGAEAEAVLAAAGEEAHRLDHPYIGTEHLLLGLLVKGGTQVTEMLWRCGMTIESARSEVERMMARQVAAR